MIKHLISTTPIPPLLHWPPHLIALQKTWIQSPHFLWELTFHIIYILYIYIYPSPNNTPEEPAGKCTWMSSPPKGSCILCSFLAHWDKMSSEPLSLRSLLLGGWWWIGDPPRRFNKRRILDIRYAVYSKKNKFFSFSIFRLTDFTTYTKLKKLVVFWKSQIGRWHDNIGNFEVRAGFHSGWCVLAEKTQSAYETTSNIKIDCLRAFSNLIYNQRCFSVRNLSKTTYSTETMKPSGKDTCRNVPHRC